MSRLYGKFILLYFCWMSFSYLIMCSIYAVFFFWKYFYFELPFCLCYYGYFMPFKNLPYRLVEGLFPRVCTYFWLFHSLLNKVIAKFLFGEYTAESFLWWLNGLFDCFLTLNPRLFDIESLVLAPGKSSKIFLLDSLCYLYPSCTDSLKLSTSSPLSSWDSS